MARTLNEFLVSTSSYSYQITDAAMAGLDVDDLSIAVILHCNLSDGSELDAIVYSDRDFTSWFAVNTIQYRLFLVQNIVRTLETETSLFPFLFGDCNMKWKKKKDPKSISLQQTMK